MRTASLCFRVEPETAEKLRLLTNGYNFTRKTQLTKTDVIESLILAASTDIALLDRAIELKNN